MRSNRQPVSGSDNSGTARKIDLRRRVIESLDRVAVLESHCGYGHMRNAVYQSAERWDGIDQRAGVATLIGDSRKWLRTMDLSPYTVFDIDPWGSPWECVWIVSRRRVLQPGERIGIAITDGTVGGGGASSRRSLRAAGWRRQQLEACGFTGDDSPRLVLGANAANMARKLLNEFFAPAKIVRFYRSQNMAGHTKYFGAVIQAPSTSVRG